MNLSEGVWPLFELVGWGNRWWLALIEGTGTGMAIMPVVKRT